MAPGWALVCILAAALTTVDVAVQEAESIDLPDSLDKQLRCGGPHIDLWRYLRQLDVYPF